eukprot:gb/GECG01000869.1/.p1 GENE.gb/GECG01000869.1/~~gb/GECG01000869.1/.p1  ORF type:complete len:247 (+),score=45.54 gb/GECG01000869.1/:1-741(+)
MASQQEPEPTPSSDTSSSVLTSTTETNGSETNAVSTAMSSLEASSAVESTGVHEQNTATSSSGAVAAVAATSSNASTSQEEEDESLRRYKDKLMEMQKATKDPSTGSVILREVRLLIKGHSDISVPLSTEEEVEQANKLHFVFKEGAKYTMRLKFSVVNHAVEHLRFKHSVYKAKLKVDELDQNLGSFPPKGEDYVYKYDFPEDEWPSGIFARGKYTAKVTFSDALDRTYCAFAYTFEIRKNWATK